jgi:alkyl hydroperoxide reductase subunit AhpF
MEEQTDKFDKKSWDALPDFLGQLPQPIRIHIWGDADASSGEAETVELIRALSDRFEAISYRLLPQRIHYSYYPVIGILQYHEEESIDYGLRIIGQPKGVQMTSLIAAIQSVSFQGMTSEATTRIRLKHLSENVILELMTSADDEAGTIMAHRIFNMAVSSPSIRSFLVMVDEFPEAAVRYSARTVPHLVINRRTHIEGLVDEAVILDHIARSLEGYVGKSNSGTTN